jgi:hypothetical protein
MSITKETKMPTKQWCDYESDDDDLGPILGPIIVKEVHDEERKFRNLTMTDVEKMEEEECRAARTWETQPTMNVTSMFMHAKHTYHWGWGIERQFLKGPPLSMKNFVKLGQRNPNLVTSIDPFWKRINGATIGKGGKNTNILQKKYNVLLEWDNNSQTMVCTGECERERFKALGHYLFWFNKNYQQRI